MDKPRSEKLSKLLKMAQLVKGIQNQPSDSTFCVRVLLLLFLALFLIVLEGGLW